MSFKTYCSRAECQIKKDRGQTNPVHRTVVPKKSIVKIYFINNGKKLSYYNDRFDLHNGDLVYVEGVMDGQIGCVIEVSYNFKIKLSDYQRVIAVVDTNVHGEFFMAGSHFVSFEPEALPAAQAKMWFLGPAKEDEEIVCSSDASSFKLDNLSGMQITHAVAERGHQYYMENRVRYLCIDGTKGYSIVEGSESYEVEFEYYDGEIRNLLCSCRCTFNCKHEFAVMLQLKETMDMIAKHYTERYEQSGFFSAVSKATLFSFTVNNKENGSIII